MAFRLLSVLRAAIDFSLKAMRRFLQGLELCRYNLFIEFQCICADYGFAKEGAELCLAQLFYVPPSCGPPV